MPKAATAQSTHLGGLEIAYVVRDVQPIATDPDSPYRTLGHVLDEHIADALRDGRDIQDIGFHFDTANPVSMNALRDMYRD